MIELRINSKSQEAQIYITSYEFKIENQFKMSNNQQFRSTSLYLGQGASHGFPWDPHQVVVLFRHQAQPLRVVLDFFLGRLVALTLFQDNDVVGNLVGRHEHR